MHRHRSVPISTMNSVIQPERLSALLEPWLPDATDRAFIVRCIALEGPIHHRGASYALLRLLGAALAEASAADDSRPGGATSDAAERATPPDHADGGAYIDVPLRLPPHLSTQAADAHYPLRMPTAPLERLAPRGSQEFEALIECLLDGPPHHALANAAMVCLLDALLRTLRAATPSAGRRG
jgi:hypothetical protein